jgi:hypothetical protein
MACMTVALLAGMGSSALAVPGWSVQQLTQNQVDDTRPRVSQNWVAWVNDFEIYLRNLASDSLIQLTSNSVQDEQPDVTGRNVIWTQFGPSGWTVKLWDRRANTRIDLGTGMWPTLSRDLAAWSDGSASSSEIYVTGVPRTSGTPVSPLTNNTIADEYPILGGNVLTWQTTTFLVGSEEVMAYDLGAWPSPIKITNNSVDDDRPFTDGQRIVWSQWDGANDTEIFLYDLQSGLTTQLTNDTEEDYAPVVSGRRVAWLSGGIDPSLKVFDLFTQVTTVVATGLGSMTDTPDIDGSRIVWQQQAGGNQEVFLAHYNSFPDVDPHSLTYFAIQWMADHEVIHGYKNGDFGPEDPVLRAQFAKIIVGLLGIPVYEGLVAPFPDLGPDDPNDLYPHDYVAAAAAAGIIRGKTSGDFDPWAAVTRAQAVTMVMRAASDYWGIPLPALPLGYAGTLNFTDPDHGYNMRQAEYVYLLEDIPGFSPNWNPWAPARRGEVAQILWALQAELAP